ncbi:MAG: ATP-binding cassette domain-containing protein [Candidatus Altiarchaeota archaeon]
MRAIETVSLSKRYGGITAVDDLNLKVREGEIFGLLGPNGAGKTTALLMLTTLIPPTSGTALVNGFDIVKEPSRVRESIGIVFQEPSSDELLTGYENLKLHGWLYGMPGRLSEERIADALELVELTGRKDDIVKKYSGGMRRRLEIARGLIHHPKVMLLDEPTIGLDPQSRDRVWEFITDLAKKEKITVVITTHYMEEADRLCDRLAIIDHGKVAVLDSPKRLKRNLGGDIIKLKAKKLNVKALEALDYVADVKKFEGGYSLTVEDAGLHLQDVLAAAGRVESVEVRSPNLDDVFMKYTGRAIRDELHNGG